MEEKDMQPMQPEGSSLTGRRIKDGARTPVAGSRRSASEGPGISAEQEIPEDQGFPETEDW